VSEGDASGGGMAGGVSGEEAAWRDLVARYEMPADGDGAPAPWPDREDLPDGQTAPASPLPSAADGADRPAEEDGTSGEARAGGDAGKRPGQVRGTGRARVIRPAAKPAAPPPPAAPPAAPAGLEPPASAAGASEEQPDEDDDTGEHYIPPPPPPLPRLDPVAKGAWAALFGGPAYLFVSTLIGWSPPGWAALLAVAAFVGGFAVIVLRMGDKPSRGDGPDNGAVV
jgi:hypothetical protein